MCMVGSDQSSSHLPASTVPTSGQPCHASIGLRSPSGNAPRDRVPQQPDDYHAMQDPCPLALSRYRDTPTRSGVFAVRYRSARRCLLCMDVQTSAGSAQIPSPAEYEIAAVAKSVCLCLGTFAITYPARLCSGMGCLHDRVQTSPADLLVPNQCLFGLLAPRRQQGCCPATRCADGPCLLPPRFT